LGFLIFLRPLMPSEHHRPLVSYGLNIYPKRVNSMYVKFCYLYKEGPNGAKEDHLLVIDIDEERTPISGS